MPFLLRSGKAMSCQTTQIVIQFRQPPHMMFEGGPRAPFEANRLVIQVQPAEGIQLHFQTKVPDAGMKLRLTDLGFNFRDQFTGGMPEAYQRLLLDVMHGDASLFSRADEVELAWAIIDPIQQGWEQSRLAAAGALRGRRLGPAQLGRMDVPPVPRVVRRLPGAEMKPTRWGIAALDPPYRKQAMARRLENAVDYLVIAISPALIITLVGSLVFFLLEVFYQGNFQLRLHYVFALFIIGAVLISRISIEDGRERALLFALPLAIVTLLAINKFVDSKATCRRRFSFLINVG